jgi:glycogen debranching enzyme GlgX
MHILQQMEEAKVNWSRVFIVSLVFCMALGTSLGSFSALADNTVKTDKTRPQAPTGLTVSAKTTTSISLSWKEAVDNFGVDRYIIYRNGVRIGEASIVNEYTDTNLMPNRSYRYTVKAYDVGRNMSPSSKTLVVKTNSEPKETAVMRVFEPSSGMTYNNFLTVRAESYSPDVTKVEVYYTDGTKAYPTTPTATQNTVAGRNTYFFSIDLSKQPDTTNAKVRIVAKNKSNAAIATREITNLEKRNLSAKLTNLVDGSTVLKNSAGDTTGTRFVVWSKYATKMQVWIYGKANPKDGRPYKILEMIKQPDVTLGGFNWVADAYNEESMSYGAGIHYGLRVWGPNFTYSTEWRPGTEFGFKADVDKDGNRFNPNKLLNDPYSRIISHDPEMLDKKYFSGAGYRHLDSGSVAPKSIVYDPTLYKGGPDKVKNIPWTDTIFYEVHVKGYTADKSSGVANPGTYKGFAQKLDHLKELGITAVEFLPIHDSPNEGRDVNGGNYWSYMTTSFFAPDRKYSSDQSLFGPIHEFKDMVKAIHDNGMEVILDVVYNHTAEGGTIKGIGVTGAAYLNFRGIDNISYYSLIAGETDKSSNRNDYLNITGCGNTFNVANPKAADFVMESLRFWVEDMKIDGFRYDLGSVLGNVVEHGPFKYDKNNSLLARILKEFPTTKHIAEPWAAGGDGSYRVGDFPGTGTTAWAEWQDKFRDTTRKAVRGDEGMIPDLATRIAGSDDLYKDDGRKPYRRSVRQTAARTTITVGIQTVTNHCAISKFAILSPTTFWLPARRWYLAVTRCVGHRKAITMRTIWTPSPLGMTGIG